ncbi:MAG: hypothetical protein RAO94_12960 [Candidatus Stygibacter australis]|nr:hypothetical protein [Candidatus Stygibacter australis]MDP8323251.1 hypothetical protein [Candidatus Stygibacter australis]
MQKKVFSLLSQVSYNRAGQSDLIELKPTKGKNPLFIPKVILEIIVWSIINGEFIHLSGPSGSAKTALIQALTMPENLYPIIDGMNNSRKSRYKKKPLKMYPIEMSTYETPAELQSVRGLSQGSTYDEDSEIVTALKNCVEDRKDFYPLIWLREMGRVISANVQGGLLNLMDKGEVILRKNEVVDCMEISYIADSNYQADEDAHFTLVPLDSALKRRFSVNITLDYLSREDEMVVLENIIKRDGKLGINHDLVIEVVNLGSRIRKNQAEGNLLSVAPPSIYGYLTYYKMAMGLQHLSHPKIAEFTLLGHASNDDQKIVHSILNDIYSVYDDDIEKDKPLSGNLT